jgi:hypothetical protein
VPDGFTSSAVSPLARTRGTETPNENQGVTPMSASNGVTVSLTSARKDVVPSERSNVEIPLRLAMVCSEFASRRSCSAPSTGKEYAAPRSSVRPLVMAVKPERESYRCHIVVMETRTLPRGGSDALSAGVGRNCAAAMDWLVATQNNARVAARYIVLQRRGNFVSK